MYFSGKWSNISWCGGWNCSNVEHFWTQSSNLRFWHKSGLSTKDEVTIMSYNVIGLVEKLVLHMLAKYFPRKMSSFFKMSIFVNSLQSGYALNQVPWLYIYSMCYTVIFAVFQCFKRPCAAELKILKIGW